MLTEHKSSNSLRDDIVMNVHHSTEHRSLCLITDRLMNQQTDRQTYIRWNTNSLTKVMTSSQLLLYLIQFHLPASAVQPSVNSSDGHFNN